MGIFCSIFYWLVEEYFITIYISLRDTHQCPKTVKLVLYRIFSLLMMQHVIFDIPADQIQEDLVKLCY